MPHPDEGLIHAWLDGELDAVEAARIEQLVTTDPDWAAAAAEARGLIAASSRIVRALDHVPGNVVPAARPARARTPWWMMRVAALLVVVAGTAIVLRERSPGAAFEQVAHPDSSLATAAEPVKPAPVAPPSPTPAAKVPASGERRPTAREPQAAPAPPTQRPAAPTDRDALPRQDALKDKAVEGIASGRRENAAVTPSAAGAASGAVVAPKAMAQLGASALSAPSRQSAKVVSQDSCFRTVDGTVRALALVRNDRGDTLIATWRDGNHATTVRVTARVDSLIGTVSVDGGPEQQFRAVRAACPKP